MITVTNVTGSGSFDEDQIISYSYSEDATPYEPENINGGAGQVTLNVIADDNPRGTRVITNNQIRVEDPEFGTVTFTAREVNLGQASASISGETIQYRLNAIRKAPAQGGSGTTLFEAILAYCALVDIFPEFEPATETKAQAIEVNYPGWDGNVWEHLKMLCAATQLDDVENTFMEMYISNDKLWFREGGKATVDFYEFGMD
jgi:hypothetical protein